jgi:CelD/BcsL family acetyltransferase involved in cellulose biosynthesis
MDVVVIDPLSEPSWDDLVSVHDEGTFFHSAAWARVLSKTYGHRPMYLRCSRGGELTALIPLMEVRSPITGCRGVSLPFTDMCAPLLHADGGAKEVIDAVSQVATERKWKYFEIRDAKLLNGGAVPSVSYLGHHLNLEGGARGCFSRCSAPVQRAVRKAEGVGLKVSTSRSADAMEVFYKLHSRTRKKHGAPPQPYSFFGNIQSEVMERGLGFVVIASQQERPVAGAVYFQLGGKGIYKFGASDERFLNMRGNNLVMWKAIEHLAENGAASLHLGRTSMGNDGLRRFKLSWGAKEERIEYVKFDMTKKKWSVSPDRTSGLHAALFRKLPVGVNRLAGRMLYPHLD